MFVAVSDVWVLKFKPLVIYCTFFDLLSFDCHTLLHGHIVCQNLPKWIIKFENVRWLSKMTKHGLIKIIFKDQSHFQLKKLIPSVSIQINNCS